MSILSEAMAESFRSGFVNPPNANNKVTTGRRKLYEHILGQAGGDPNGELDYSMKLIKDGEPDIQKYVLSKGETPAPDAEDLALQAYNLRCQEIDNIANTIGVPDTDAQIFLEQDEDEAKGANSSAVDSNIGALFAPIGLAAKHLHRKGVAGHADNAAGGLLGGLLSGVIGAAGAKINSGDLMRAAEGKSAGIFGALGTGGTKFYDALRAYLQNPANADEKQNVLNGTITDVSMLRGYQSLPQGGLAVQAQQVTSQLKANAIQQYLPYIFIGVIVLIVIIVVATKSVDRK